MHRLAYTFHGPLEGFPVVLLHHGLGSSSAWRAQVPALVEAGFRVLTYDRWGYGASEPRARLHTPWFEPDVDDLRALLDALGLGEVALVGHSDGGTIALYFAARYPARVRALVTVAAHVYVDPTMQPGMEALRRTYETSEAFRRALDRTHGGRGAAVFEMWYNGWHRPDVLGWDARPVLRQVEAPALVVQGTADEYAPPSHAEAIAVALPDARLALLPDAPHMLPQERPEDFNTLMLDFLTNQTT